MAGGVTTKSAIGRVRGWCLSGALLLSTDSDFLRGSWITSDRFAATPGKEHKEVPPPGYLRCRLVCIFRSASIWG